MRVLVVDDNSLTADSLGQALREANVQVEVVYNGPDCLSRVKRDPSIDVIVLDMGMPGMSGAQVLTEFSKWNPKPGFKIILSTAYANWQSDLIEKTAGGTVRWSNGTVLGDQSNEKSPFDDFLIGELDKSSGFLVIVHQIKDLLASVQK